MDIIYKVDLRGEPGLGRGSDQGYIVAQTNEILRQGMAANGAAAAPPNFLRQHQDLHSTNTLTSN